MVTVITKTIDAGGGGDYTSFTQAEADVANIGTSADLVANDEAIVFECVAGTYAEAVAFSSGMTMDATRNVTYRAAAGSAHTGTLGTGVNIATSDPGYGSVLRIRESFLVFDGLCVNATNGVGGSRTAVELDPLASDIEGIQLRNMLMATGSPRQVLGASPSFNFSSAAAPLVVENCVLHRTTAATTVNLPLGPGGAAYVEFVNTTCAGVAAGSRFFNSFVDTGGSINASFVNCLSAVQQSIRFLGTGSSTVTGSGNVGGSAEAFPPAVAAGGQSWVFTIDQAPGVGDWVIYNPDTGQLIDAPTGVLEGASGSDDPNVPDTGILGYSRAISPTFPGAYARLETDTTMTHIVLNTRVNNGAPRFNSVGAGQAVILPADFEPVFFVFGDSISCGHSPGSTFADFKDDLGNGVPETAYGRINYGSFWDKWMSTGDGGLNFDNSDRYTDENTAGAAFSQIHAGIGGIGSGGPAAYADLENGSPVWGIARELYGLFRDPLGNIVLPKFIHMGRTSTALAPFANAPASWDPGTVGSTGQLFFDHYVTPAVAAITGTPVFCGAICIAGGVNAHGAYGLEDLAGATTTALRRKFEEVLSIESLPWVSVLPRTTPNASYPDANVAKVRDDLTQAARGEAPTVIVEPRGVELADSDNVHTTPRGTAQLGCLIGSEYRDLLASDALVVGFTPSS